jgi:hypothetical protein
MRRAMTAALLVAALGVTGCATADRMAGPGHARGDYRYTGENYQRLGNDCPAFGGAGGRMLDPWLACTREGQDLVRYRYGRESERLNPAMADQLNIWFRKHADTNRDLCLTDPEIRTALVNAVRWQRRMGARG